MTTRQAVPETTDSVIDSVGRDPATRAFEETAVAGGGHFFSQPGCPHCAADRATTVREHAQASNMLAQAQLEQLNAVNAKLAQQTQLQQQQTSLMETQLDEQRRFQIAQWLQTPDGKAY